MSMIDPPDIHYIDRIETVDQSSNDDAASSSYTSANPIKLGDFSKLFAEFLDSPPPQHRYDPGPDFLARSDYDDDYSPAQIVLEPASLSSTPSSYGPELLPPAKRSHTSIVHHDLPCDIKALPSSEQHIDSAYGTTSSPPDLSPSACRHPSSQGRGRRRAGQSDFLTSSSPECPECSPPANTMRHSRSLMNKLPSDVREKLRLKDDRHRALMMNLVPYRMRDASMAGKHPTITSQGIHVFVDMSNIDIGYQKTLKGSQRINANTRLSPVPHLNLQFLTKILVRDRPVVALNVCCSTLPGRSEPRFVQQMRELGYHVDLRERKGVLDGGLTFTGAPDTLRYVEDLVDETLQVRIAESVMEYFRTPGTIVLATGDAKPSPHSDGFFSYVERALKMGWNVEVISWRGNLSQRWIDREWTSQWHDKFRVILLDEFLEALK
ncbi:uncharacterized protein Triagg1_8163 [Trichoderma aggressivum f. europaeum]|uniref:NYN domain-containing protein n=1 Tax=Trichoderma aggressivum f. europaeum TaxID=173218 RepID=A0AAE1I874_9HYPO|nr:hypothetical protein Triagg1_8163 [Trichoderma aggressivum f. europaeum]